MVAKNLVDADRILEMAGYEMDLTGHQMTLKQHPQPERILRTAVELFLLSLELSIQSEILCLVQAQGFKACSVLRCRTSIAADNEASAKWITSNCTPGHPSRPKLQTVECPEYAEIPSNSDVCQSSRSSKSSSSETVSSGSVLDRNENIKQQPPEPIYSVVKKPPKSSVENDDSYLYGFDPNHLHALRRSPNMPKPETVSFMQPPSPSEPNKAPPSVPVTFSTFRPENDLRVSNIPRYIPPDSHYENIHLMAIGERVEKKPRLPALNAIPVRLPSPPPPAPNHTYANLSETESEHRKFSGITAAISSKYDALPCRRVTSPPNGHEGPMVVMGNRWQCSSCTSFNLQGTEICDICGKSRLKGAEQFPLASAGGAQCPKCTLINSKGAKSCAACDRLLRNDDATYI
jgi:hypothetical protein